MFWGYLCMQNKNQDSIVQVNLISENPKTYLDFQRMFPDEISCIMAYCSVAHNRFRHPCQNRIATLADGSASDVHLRTDLPKNKPTVSFLKATTAYLTLRAVEYLPASKGRSAPHNLPMEPKGSPSEDYSTSASPLHVSQRNL